MFSPPFTTADHCLAALRENGFAVLDAAAEAGALEAALPPQAVKVDAASKTASAERMVVFFMEMPSFFIVFCKIKVDF